MTNVHVSAMLELARAKSNYHIILCKWVGFMMGQPLMLKIITKME